MTDNEQHRRSSEMQRICNEASAKLASGWSGDAPSPEGQLGHMKKTAGPRTLFTGRFADVSEAAAGINDADILAVYPGNTNAIRDVVESIKYAPAASPYKLILVFGLAYLSPGALCALQKTMEDVPDHIRIVVFGG